MCSIQKFENFRTEINKIKKTIKVQEDHIIKNKHKGEIINRIKEKLNENLIKLSCLNNEFKEFINAELKTNPGLITERIKYHSNLIKQIEEFSKERCLGERMYTHERRSNIKQLKKSWIDFRDKIYLPDTYLIPEYELIHKLNLRETINKYTNLNFSSHKIQEIEQTRQSITSLSKENSLNDMKLDKGSAWGVSEKEIEEASKSYSVIAKEIKLKDHEIENVLMDIGHNSPEIIDLWVSLHLLTCISIVNLADTESANIIDREDVRISLAGETFNQWEQINAKNIRYIIPNTYYLLDYDSHFNEIFKKFERN